VQTAEEASLAVTYYVALPFIRTEDGTAPGEARECQSEAAAIRRAEGMSRDPANAGAVAFKRAGDPKRVFGRGCTEEVWQCAGRFERAVTMTALLLRHDRDGRGGYAVVVAPSLSARQLPRLRRSRRVLQQCSDSVAMGAIDGVIGQPACG
jgi:hypothetical protein